MTPSCTSGVNSLTRRRIQAPGPRHLQVLHGVAIDLLERAVRPAIVRASPVKPVARRRITQHLVGHRRQAIQRRAQDREGFLRERGQHAAATATAAAAFRGCGIAGAAAAGRRRLRRRSAPGGGSLSRRLRQDRAVQNRPRGEHNQTRANGTRKCPCERSRQTHKTASRERIVVSKFQVFSRSLYQREIPNRLDAILQCVGQQSALASAGPAASGSGREQEL